MLNELASKSRFEALFRDHYAPLVGYAMRITKDKDLAEDLVQQVFVNLWEKRESIEIHSSLKSYLMRAVHNHCLNHVKHEKVRASHRDEVMHDTSVSEAVDPVEQAELSLRVNELIDGLPEQCRNVFLLSRRDGRKYKEIAEELNISVKTVENQMGKALRLLRQGLKEHVSSRLRILAIIFWMLVGVKHLSVVIDKQ